MNMTKEQALNAMKDGKKITHINFDITEWMTMQNGKITFEDGYSCYPHEFWADRKGDSWNEGYSIHY